MNISMFKRLPCYDYKRMSVPSGHEFRPDGHDPCKICLCFNGSILLCKSPMCFPNCVSFIQNEDECCKFRCLPFNNDSTSAQPIIKVISFEPESVKQGARFGATALTVSLVISLFIFMIMRLKRRQALLNTLNQRSSIVRQNLVQFPDNNNNNLDNFDDLLYFQHIFTSTSRSDNNNNINNNNNNNNNNYTQFHRSYPSTSDFVHFLPVSSLIQASTSNPRPVNDLEPVSFTLFDLDLPSYDAIAEKNGDWPPPYEAPPPYSQATNREAGEGVNTDMIGATSSEEVVPYSDIYHLVPDTLVTVTTADTTTTSASSIGNEVATGTNTRVEGV